MTNSIPLIDSHIHLWPASELRTLRWNKPGGPFDNQYSVDEYRAAIGPVADRLQGFVFIESDRHSNPFEEVGWTDPFREVDFLQRVVEARPRKGEGHGPVDGKLCLAAIFWAPVPAGPEVLSRYVDKLRSRAGPSLSRAVKGFRYLVQDKPRGTMLDLDFIQSLRWLGRHGYAFDLGIDQSSGGLWQLDEAIDMMLRVNHGVDPENMVKIVINHMCKPCMKRIKTQPKDVPFADAQTGFVEWRDRISYLASFPNTYMKLSGVFSEIDQLPDEGIQNSLDFWDRQRFLNDVIEHIGPWIRHCLEVFGPSRCMFGSNWPVDNYGGGGNGISFLNWYSIMRSFCHRMSKEEAEMVWYGTVNRVYGLGI